MGINGWKGVAMEFKDYYDIMGVSRDASQEEIQKKYRELAKKYHPDLNRDDETAQERFKEINEAYDVLGDAEKRANYDRFGSGTGFSHGQNFDPSQFGHTFTMGEDFNFSDIFGSDIFSDIFSSFKGGSRRSAGGFGGFDDRFTTRPAEIPKYDANLNINIEEGINGTKKTVPLKIEGEVKFIEVNVPKGVVTGQKVRVNGDKWGFNGEVLFEINILNDAINSLDNNLNITSKLEVYPWESALGETVVADTLRGKIRVKLPEGISSGKKIKIPNKGYENRKGRIGNLFLEVTIVQPDNISDDLKKLYEEMKNLEENK